MNGFLVSALSNNGFLVSVLSNNEIRQQTIILAVLGVFALILNCIWHILNYAGCYTNTCFIARREICSFSRSAFLPIISEQKISRMEVGFTGLLRLFRQYFHLWE